MSVDNFYASGRLIYALRKGFLPWHFYRLPTGGKSDGFDGHFVAQRNASAQRQCQEFIGTSITAGVPTVTQ